MKDKRIGWIAGAMVALCTALLFVAVFSAQEVRAQQPMEAYIEEQQTEETAAQPAAASAAEESEKLLPIDSVPLPQKELKPEEALFPSWMEDEPGPADITDEQAVENAVLVAETLFGIEKPTVRDMKFYRDMTGQRSNYWDIAFVEENLMMSVNALTGNVYFADADQLFERGKSYSFLLPSSKEDYDPAQDEYLKLTAEIMAEIENGDSEYLTATLALTQDFLPGGTVKQTEINAVHGDGHYHPAVSIIVEMQDGTSYMVEWVKDGQTGELLLYRLYAYPTRDHLVAGTPYHADMLWQNAQVPKLLEESLDAPATEPLPTPQPQPLTN